MDRAIASVAAVGEEGSVSASGEDVLALSAAVPSLRQAIHAYPCLLCAGGAAVPAVSLLREWSPAGDEGALGFLPQFGRCSGCYNADGDTPDRGVPIFFPCLYRPGAARCWRAAIPSTSRSPPEKTPRTGTSTSPPGSSSSALFLDHPGRRRTGPPALRGVPGTPSFERQPRPLSALASPHPGMPTSFALLWMPEPSRQARAAGVAALQASLAARGHGCGPSSADRAFA